MKTPAEWMSSNEVTAFLAARDEEHRRKKPTCAGTYSPTFCSHGLAVTYCCTTCGRTLAMVGPSRDLCIRARRANPRHLFERLISA